MDDLKTATLLPILQAHIDSSAHVMKDESAQYKSLNKNFGAHSFVRHSAGEYVSKADKAQHTNTIEGFFSVFKRGMKGVYQHCGHNYLSRYVAEFDFRYNNRIALGVNDHARADALLQGLIGKRLTYKLAH